MLELLSDIRDFVLPRRCAMCHNRLGGDERVFCTACLLHLPLTECHLVEHSPLEKQFWGLFPIERAASLLFHDGSEVRRIIYKMKYEGRPEIGLGVARLYAEQLKEKGFFEGMDCIVPVPLSWRRRWHRRYNQSHFVAEGISRATGLPVYGNVVTRAVDNPSQTTVGLHERRDNVEGIFRLKRPHRIAGKHILLVDDVTTTGATIASCGAELAKAPDVRISVLTVSVGGHSPIPFSDNDWVDSSVFGMELVE